MKRRRGNDMNNHTLIMAIAVVVGLIITAVATLNTPPKGSSAASCGGPNQACCWIKNSSGGYSPSCSGGLACKHINGQNLCVGAPTAPPRQPTAAIPTALPRTPTPLPQSGCGKLNQACCWVKSGSSYVPQCSQGTCKYDSVKKSNFCR